MIERVKSSHRIEVLLRHYMIAIVTVLVAFVLTLASSPVVEPGLSPLFLLAVMISSWRGGLGVGIFATILSTALSAFVFLNPRFSLYLERTDLTQLFVFFVSALVVGSLSAARKQAEEANEVLLIKERNARHLEEQARRKADDANKVKDEFLAAVSHELRTPLTTIKTITRILQKRELTEEERLEYLSEISSECDREIDLVLNLLDVSRIKTGGIRIQLREVEAEVAIRSAEKLTIGLIQQKNQTLSVAATPGLTPIYADPSALRRSLCAVIENAIKYSPENGLIKILASRFNDEVRIEVEDDGRGIAAEDLPFVFEKFYRGRIGNGKSADETEEVPGIGLGLNLAKTLIEGMNGRIVVESSPGAGTKVSIFLPVSTSVEKADFPDSPRKIEGAA